MRRGSASSARIVTPLCPCRTRGALVVPPAFAALKTINAREQPYDRANGRTRSSLRLDNPGVPAPAEATGSSWSRRRGFHHLCLLPCTYRQLSGKPGGYLFPRKLMSGLIERIITEVRIESRVGATQRVALSGHAHMGRPYSSRVRKCGKRITSRMLGLSVISIVRRSMPMPKPPVGGMP